MKLGTQEPTEQPVRPTPHSSLDWEQLRASLVACRPEDQSAETPKRPALRRRLIIGALFGAVAGLGFVVASEIAALPNQAFAGALLRARIQVAKLQQSVGAPEIEILQSSLGAVKDRAKQKALAQAGKSFHQARKSDKNGGKNSGHPVAVSQVVTPHQRPFRVEVVDSKKRTILQGADKAITLGIDDDPAVPAATQDDPPVRLAPYPALISAD